MSTILKYDLKFQSYVQFWEYLPQEECVIVDYLRSLVLKTLPASCKEKLTYNVPFYYGKGRICLIWPASVPKCGIKSGVLFGFAQGDRLEDPNKYLTHGTNRKIFYRVYQSINEIDQKEIIALLKEAIKIDNQFK